MSRPTQAIKATARHAATSRARPKRGSSVNTSNDLPLWLVIGFTIMAVLVVLIVAWYLSQRSRGKVPPKRERVYMGFLIALLIWGFINDGLEAVVKLIFP